MPLIARTLVKPHWSVGALETAGHHTPRRLTHLDFHDYV